MPSETIRSLIARLLSIKRIFNDDLGWKNNTRLAARLGRGDGSEFCVYRTRVQRAAPIRQTQNQFRISVETAYLPIEILFDAHEHAPFT
jgi:hypothetical protein